MEITLLRYLRNMNQLEFYLSIPTLGKKEAIFSHRGMNLYKSGVIAVGVIFQRNKEILQDHSFLICFHPAIASMHIFV